jgi:hypothetical protein
VDCFYNIWSPTGVVPEDAQGQYTDLGAAMKAATNMAQVQRDDDFYVMRAELLISRKEALMRPINPPKMAMPPKEP